MAGRARSEESRQRAARLIPGGVSSSFRAIVPQLEFERARGAVMVDLDGHEYIDYHAGFGPPILGYHHAGVLRRVTEALAAVDLKRSHVSYAHTDTHVDRTLEACREVLRALAAEPRSPRVGVLA